MITLKMKMVIPLVKIKSLNKEEESRENLSLRIRREKRNSLQAGISSLNVYYLSELRIRYFCNRFAKNEPKFLAISWGAF